QVTVEALSDSRWCIPSEWSRLRHNLEEMFRRAGRGLPEQGFITSDLSMIVNLMSSAQCITIMPARVARHIVRAKLGKIIKFNVGGYSERINMVWYDKIRPRTTADLFKKLVLQTST